MIQNYDLSNSGCKKNIQIYTVLYKIEYKCLLNWESVDLLHLRIRVNKV